MMQENERHVTARWDAMRHWACQIGLARNADTQFVKCVAGFEVIWLPHRAEKQPQAKLYGEIFQVPGMQKRMRGCENVNTHRYFSCLRGAPSLSISLFMEERSGMLAQEKFYGGTHLYPNLTISSRIIRLSFSSKHRAEQTINVDTNMWVTEFPAHWHNREVTSNRF